MCHLKNKKAFDSGDFFESDLNTFIKITRLSVGTHGIVQANRALDSV